MYDAKYVDVVGVTARIARGDKYSPSRRTRNFNDGYRSRLVRAENMGLVLLCDMRGRLSPNAPTRSAQGPASGCTTICRQTNGNFVLYRRRGLSTHLFVSLSFSRLRTRRSD